MSDHLRVPRFDGPSIEASSAPSLRKWSWVTVAALLLVVAGGRWGSWIYIPGTPIFATDLCVLLGIFGICMSGGLVVRRIARWEYLASTLFFGVAVVALFASREISLQAIRDIVPLVYLALVPLIASACSILGVRTVMHAIGVASVIHTCWFFLVQVSVLHEISVPFVGVPVFATRGDFDSLVSGFCIAYLMLIKWPLFSRLLIGALALSTMLLYGSRAGLLSGLLVVVIVGIFGRRAARLRLDVVVVCGVLGVTLAVSALVAGGGSLAFPAWANSLARLSGDDETAAGASGINTASARTQAWSLIVRYTTEVASRSWFGSGAGASVNVESGALPYLSGDPSVRAAHNFIVTWFSEFGILGCGLILLGLLVYVVSQVAAVLGRADPVTWNALILGSVLGTTLAGLVGVILESPFGYLFFAFALALGRAAGAGQRGVARSRTWVYPLRPRRRPAPHSTVAEPRADA